ncbi:nucleotidyltransferase domain-containing protein [Candidatus Sumerlaeota bacterium]|nr:nucleotidyltransferase domain-containing protein [Candidatus Sumerlaeota bacterium]
MKIAVKIGSDVIKAAEALRGAGARDVYVFGSAARGVSHAGSDLDLAVSGLPPSRFFEAMARAAEQLERPLDLIDLDEDTPLTRYLKQENELVHVP